MKNIPDWHFKHNKKENTLILSNKDIEEYSKEFLQDYSNTNNNYSILIPQHTPIEEIIEFYCDIPLEFQTFENQAVLGMTCFSSGLIKIRRDSKIVPYKVEKGTIIIANDLAENEELRGRYFYTIAHEFGHSLFHRVLFEEADYIGQPSLFEDEIKSVNAITCHRDEVENFNFFAREKNWTEWQADYFASCLLMPKESIYEFWKDYISEPEFILGENPKSLLNGMNPLKKGILFAEFVDTYKVSRQAARIRLEKLNFLDKEDVL